MTEERLEDKLHRVVQNRKVTEEVVSEQRYLEASRKRLLRIIQKKITTSFIGALAKMESFVGTTLWGHGKDECECTPDQLAWRDIWEECRTEILNNGNNQLRAVETEFEQYTIKWNRYQTVIPVDRG